MMHHAHPASDFAKTREISADFQKHQKSILIILYSIIGLSLLLHLISMYAINLLVEEAYYWNYAQHLDFGYLDHPPMVALLIRGSTVLFGHHEFSVRFPALICWLLTSCFIYKLTSQVYYATTKTNDPANRRIIALSAVMLLAILPFFFFQTLVITPDLPLLVCWSASLYYFYRCLVLHEARSWYAVGLCLGLGLLSKYTIVLSGLAGFFYMLVIPDARFWFKRKEPYCCAALAIALFTPVIYWNATHAWVSFLFQSQRRFAALTSIDLPYLLALMLVFITPWGISALWHLITSCKQDGLKQDHHAVHTRYFLMIFTSIPFGFFALYSLNHEINLNWSGPLFLALLPWIALCMSNQKMQAKGRFTNITSLFISNRKNWITIASILLSIYIAIFLLIRFNPSVFIQKNVFAKVLNWELLIKQFSLISAQIAAQTHKSPVLIPLDKYAIASELFFYQSKLLAQGKIRSVDTITGGHVLGVDSLMYRYWSPPVSLSGRTLILISQEPWRLETADLRSRLKVEGSLHEIWSYGQGQALRNTPFYYKVVEIKEQK